MVSFLLSVVAVVVESRVEQVNVVAQVLPPTHVDQIESFPRSNHYTLLLLTLVVLQ